jgi:glycosyltransferase involved in cell wall biosynthesis
MANPLVSICVPTYNRAAWLRDSLKSICGQDYTPVEILISDNGSDDGTEDIGREAAKADPRVRYVRHPRNLGVYGNHNFCIDESRGELLTFFHDHDERSPQMVSEYAAFLQQHPEVGVVCSDWELINEAGELVGVRDSPVPAVTPGLEYISQTMRSGRSSIGVPGMLVRRSALGASRFDERGPAGFGDFVVWFELAERAAVGHIDRRLWRWRQQRASQSARTIESMVKDYEINLGGYCDAHLTRWPQHAALVARWRADIRRFLFWALAFELGLHFRNETGAGARRSQVPTIFEILGYRLSAEEVRRVRELLAVHRTGPLQHAVYATIELLVGLGFTWPLGQATHYHGAARAILGLR